jgi:hypothetical protein
MRPSHRPRGRTTEDRQAVVGDDPSGNELVVELLARVEGLDQILDDGGPVA